MTTNSIVRADEARKGKENPLTRFFPSAARIVLALIFLASGVFGLLMLLHIVPQPSAPMPAGATAFNGALAKTGYMMPLMGATDLIAGILLLSNRFVPLALALLAPIIVNIVAFHIFLAPSGIGPGIVAAALEVYLAWAYRNAFRPMLALRAAPEAIERSGN